MSSANDVTFLRKAYEQALKSYNEGGLPIGAVMVRNGRVIAVCAKAPFKSVGREARSRYRIAITSARA